LRAVRKLQQKMLPGLHTAAALDIVLEVGCGQERGHPLGTKALLALKLGAPATISRRLSRLKKQGIIKPRTAHSDGRRHDLLLSEPFRRDVEKLSRACRKVLLS